MKMLLYSQPQIRWLTQFKKNPMENLELHQCGWRLEHNLTLQTRLCKIFPNRRMNVFHTTQTMLPQLKLELRGLCFILSIKKVEAILKTISGDGFQHVFKKYALSKLQNSERGASENTTQPIPC